MVSIKRNNSWQAAFFWWTFILTALLLSSLIPAALLPWRPHVSGCAWVAERWDWEIAVAILLQVETVSVRVGQLPALIGRGRVWSQYEVIDFGRLLWSVFLYYWHYNLSSWLVFAEPVFDCYILVHVAERQTLRFFFVHMSKIFPSNTPHCYGNAVIARMFNIIIILWICRIWEFLKLWNYLLGKERRGGDGDFLREAEEVGRKWVSAWGHAQCTSQPECPPQAASGLGRCTHLSVICPRTGDPPSAWANMARVSAFMDLAEAEEFPTGPSAGAEGTALFCGVQHPLIPGESTQPAN